MNRRTFLQSVLSAIGFAPVVACASRCFATNSKAATIKRMVGQIDYRHGVIRWFSPCEIRLFYHKCGDELVPGSVVFGRPDGPPIRDDGHGNLYVEETNHS